MNKQDTRFWVIMLFVTIIGICVGAIIASTENKKCVRKEEWRCAVSYDDGKTWKAVSSDSCNCLNR